MIEWVFFDLGGTLLDDSELENHIVDTARQVLTENGYKVDEISFLRAVRIARSRLGSPLRFLLSLYTGDSSTARNLARETRARTRTEGAHMQRVFPESEKALGAIGRDFSIGLIANQEPAIRELLRTENLEKQFSVIVISGEVGIEKPDERIFRLALSIAKCVPEEAVMVGDRIDNDISPARSIGMKTIRLRRGIFMNQEPLSDGERPDMEIRTIEDLPGALKSLAFH